MRDGRVDGVITAAFLDDSTERYIKFSSPPYNLKIVTISPPVKGIPSVNCDEWKAGEIVAEHLIEIGCRQFVFFGGGKDFGRYGGFSEYLTQKGFVKPECFYETGYVGEFGKARKLAIKLLEGKKKFDGVFAHNDIYATALKMEALRKGIRIPDDLAIVGYDNTNVCEMSQPTLSSIDTNPLMLVKTALDKLSRLIDNSMKDEENTKIQPNLIIRESSGGVMKNLNLEKNLELVRNGKKNARNRKE
jgi:LacI family transcriptional regulator